MGNTKHSNLPEWVFLLSSILVPQAVFGQDADFDSSSFELFLLADGEKKITETPFPRK